MKNNMKRLNPNINKNTCKRAQFFCLKIATAKRVKK